MQLQMHSWAVAAAHNGGSWALSGVPFMLFLLVLAAF
jgi:hypothetical protein